MEHRILTKREQEICRNNLLDIEAIHRFCTKKCTNPFCGYPLSGLVENNFSVETNGPICELCHAMDFAVRRCPKLVAAHEAWRIEQKKKNKIIEKDGTDYFRG